MADVTLTAEPNKFVQSATAGENAYAIHISGDFLAPEVDDGQCAVFDPDAGLALRDGIVAVWLHERADPIVVRLALAVPPFTGTDEDNVRPLLAIRTTQGTKMIDMSRVKRVDRLVDVQT